MSLCTLSQNLKKTWRNNRIYMIRKKKESLYTVTAITNLLLLREKFIDVI